MQWNLHVVGEALEADLEEVLADFVSNLETIGHKLTSAVLTTDTGPKSLPTTPVDSAPVESTETAESTESSSVPVDTPPTLAPTSSL